MKKILVALGAVSVLGAGAVLVAGEEKFDLKSACDQYVQANPDTTLDCGCLVSEVGDNADLLADFKAISEGAEPSAAAGAVVQKCSMPAE